MIREIAVRCPECGWVGRAPVGEGMSIGDYKCPACNSPSLKELKNRTPGGKMARLKKSFGFTLNEFRF